MHSRIIPKHADVSNRDGGMYDADTANPISSTATVIGVTHFLAGRASGSNCATMQAWMEDKAKQGKETIASLLTPTTAGDRILSRQGKKGHMEEHRCPGCGKPTTVPGMLCSACCASGYSGIPGDSYSTSLEDLERQERERVEFREHMERLEKERPPTREDLERVRRVEQLKKQMTPSSKPDTSDSQTEVAGESRNRGKTRKTKTEVETERYTLSQVAAAAGRAVAAVGKNGLPLDAQRDALELAKRWLLELKE